MANHKPRTIRQQRAVNRKHRKAAKAAQRRNQGKWAGYSGEQKRNAVKAAFKASLMLDSSKSVPSIFSGQMKAQMPFLILPDWLKKPVYDQPQPLPELKSWSHRSKAA